MVISEDISLRYKEKLIEGLNNFDEFCNINNLHYFAAYGTCIGAVRHKGFIPWDDDIDLYMPRKDYERLKTLKESIPSPYCIFDNNLDGYYQPYIKFVNNSTSLLELPESMIVSGVFIDIFPLDFAPFEYERCKYLKNKYTRIYWRYINIFKRKSSWRDLFRQRYRKHFSRILLGYLENRLVFSHIKSKVKSEFIKFKYSYFRYEKGKYVISYCGPYKEKEIMKSKWFDEYKYVPFENTHIRICSEWNMYLEHLYGDYMTLPPVGQRVSHHAHYYLNLDKGMTREEILKEIDKNKNEYIISNWKEIGI